MSRKISPKLGNRQIGINWVFLQGSLRPVVQILCGLSDSLGVHLSTGSANTGGVVKGFEIN